MRKIIVFTLAAAFILCFLTGCVNQHPEEAEESVEELCIIATSMATVEIMDRLGVDLAGIPHSDLSDSPERYRDVQEVGYPMSPDIEIIKSLDPDWVFGPNSLEADLKPKYEAAGVSAAFLNLRSVEGMYHSIQDLGELLGCEEEAAALIEEYNAFYEAYKDTNADKEQPRVLVLMGLPGSYVVATENSYVGSLVKMTGGINVYEGEAEEFIAANTEDMLERDPDIILRAAHALPDEVVEMFAEEFEQNDIWKHFKAVQENQVHDLPYELFGMSANFDYPDALEILQEMLYGEDT